MDPKMEETLIKPCENYDSAPKGVLTSTRSNQLSIDPGNSSEGPKWNTKLQKSPVKPVENDDLWSKRGHDEY